MNKNARAVQDKLERMQHACDVGAIRQRAATAVQRGDDATDEKKHQRTLYVLAALVKALADVPEQIWRALESHHYLHAGRLYTLASVVHDHLEQETDEDIQLDVR
ncbi:hypothetical protein BCR43DRAFT_359566 [Syncephalastrum racemosum]|uniref:Conserved oligomeric Golgi complex subunit 1 n=1 Tax=Syncephalastrum racemosum TaxID=13706 RepID=A0A1X2H707_SYNRA|nr:hypothetical protein BCR43DRAFT_359566 [Syncephalastrum racemosum]